MSHPLHQKYLRQATPFCPGCGHAIFMNGFLHAADESGLDFDRAVFVSGIGCGAWVPSPHFLADTLHVTHGRPIPFATGVKLCRPELEVIVISGDGDLATIGGNHLIHAARRDVAIKVFCLNNWVYAMTGGQVSATTPQGAITSTTPWGNPERAFDLVNLVRGAGGRYVARFALVWPRKLIKGLKNALQFKGFAFVDVLSPCPTEYVKANLEKPGTMAMLEWQKQNCVDRRVARQDPARAEGKILTGEWVEGDAE